jgi:hypothetical protein
MGQHQIQHIVRNEYDRTARCTCGWTPDPSKTFRTKDMVMDQVRQHERIVERARIAANRGAGSISADLRHFDAMAANPNVSAEHRALWRQLAEELRARLGTKPTDDEQPSLFAMKE